LQQSQVLILRSKRDVEQLGRQGPISLKWRAQMLVDLERCPVEITSVRNPWVATLETPLGEVLRKFPTLEPAITWLNKAK
jgi:hypothetical protein